MVKKNVLVVVIAVVAVVVAILIYVYLSRIGTLEYKISKYLRENYSEEGVAISLSDFTDFEWEAALVFFPNTTTRDIQDSLGVEYSRSLDLLAGIIFTNDNEVVYEEMFREYSHFDNMPPFYISPNPKDPDDSQRAWFKVFTTETAVFQGYVMNNSEREYYRLYPITAK